MENKVIEIIKEVLSDNSKELKSEFNRETSLRRDLNFDSFDLAVLTVKIEDEFDVDIFEDGIVDTVSEIFNKLSQER
jgi:acyl carrier protein